MARRGEHRISGVSDNASEFGERVLGTGTDEEVITSPAVEPSEDERWIREVQEKIKRASGGSRQRSRLSDNERVPKICKFKPGGEFCRPRVVAIGPFHRHESTSIDDEDKWWIVDLMNDSYGLDLAGCLIKMKNLVADALTCYSDSDISQSFGSINYKEFAEMLLLDSYFILFMLASIKVNEVIRHRKLGTELLHVLSRASDIRLQRDKIMMDLLIVDNQIPFFVIEELFKELESEKQPLHTCALEFFEKIHPRSNQGSRKGQNDPPEFLHLLDLFHWSRVPEGTYYLFSSWYHQLESIDWARHVPTAMELRESAIMFEKKTSGSSLDVTFRQRRLMSCIAVLNIPDLHIHDYSSFIFHNLIAFEMQCPSQGRCTMTFSAFMSNLLQREEDVKLLRQCGILANMTMTDSELIDFFKCLSRLMDNYQMPRDLYALYSQVLSHHGRRTRRFCGNFILHYFPLVTYSVIIAAMLFVLTLLQTIYTMLGNNRN